MDVRFHRASKAAALTLLIILTTALVSVWLNNPQLLFASFSQLFVLVMWTQLFFFRQTDKTRIAEINRTTDNIDGNIGRTGGFTVTITLSNSTFSP